MLRETSSPAVSTKPEAGVTTEADQAWRPIAARLRPQATGAPRSSALRRTRARPGLPRDTALALAKRAGPLACAINARTNLLSRPNRNRTRSVFGAATLLTLRVRSQVTGARRRLDMRCL